MLALRANTFTYTDVYSILLMLHLMAKYLQCDTRVRSEWSFRVRPGN
jgi:hypothetical protein